MSPQVPPLTDREGILLAGLTFTRHLGWIFRELPVTDIGIDAVVEVVSEGAATGEWIALQVKSGNSYLRERTSDGFVFRGDAQHLEYWLGCPIPVLLILCSPEQNRCWWQPIDGERAESTGKGWKTTVPLVNELGERSAEAIRAFVKTWQAARREHGLPAEDELAVIFHWLGRCKLVHKLHQSVYPPGAVSQFQVPDLLAAFDVDGNAVPVLIEVADVPAGIPLWEPSYVESLQSYAALVGLPLLIAMKYATFWHLFEARHLRRTKDKLTITPSDAMRETLLGLLAGDFSFSFRPGVGIHIKSRKVKETEDGFDFVVEEAYLLNAEGEKHTGKGGILQLFTCIEQESRVQEDETHVVQSFVIPTDGCAEFAHRALVTLLRTFGGGDTIDWHQVLVRSQPPILFMSPHEAVQNGLEAGFIRRKITIRPQTNPTFIGVRGG